MAIGNPITLTSNVASKTLNVIATASQSLFTVAGGYRINEIAVFRNGVRLVDGRDFTARDGTTVTLLSAASEGDVVEFQVFDTFRVADAITPFDSDQTIAGNLNITGILSASQLGSVNFNVTSGIQTFNDVRVGGALTVAGVLTYDDVTNVDSVGVITARSGINIVGGGLTATGVSTFFSEVRVGTANSNNAFVNINPPSGHGDQYVMRLRNDGDNSTKLLFANKSAGLGQIWYQEAFRFVDDANSDAERLRIDSDGRVIIGTNSGSGNITLKLQGHSGNSTQDAKIRLCRGTDSPSDTNQLGAIFFSDNSESPSADIIAIRDGGTWSGSSKPGALKFATTANGAASATERLRINSNGDILIAKITTALDTAGSRLSSGLFAASGDSSSTNLATNSGGNLSLANVDSTDNNFSNIGGYNSNGLVVNQIDFINKSHSSRTGEISFLTHNGSNLTERLRITSGGDVGIGTDSPTSFGPTLQVAGTDPALLVQDTATAVDYFGMNIASGAVNTWFDDASAFVIHTATGLAGSGLVERLRIKSDGDVGIGTADPTEKLHVFNRTSNGGLIHYDGASNSHFGLRIRSNSDGGNFESDFANGTTAMLDLFADAGTVSGGDFLVCRSQDANPILLVKGNGRIGVGSDDPQAFLAIQGDSNDSTLPSIRLQDGTDARQVSITNSAGDFVVGTHGADNSHHGQIKIFEGGQISLLNGGSSGSLTERLRVATDGSVTKPTNPLIKANMGSTYGSAGSLHTSPAVAILQSAAEIDKGDNGWTTTGSNAYTYVCPVAGVYAVHAHFSLNDITQGNRVIWAIAYTDGGGNLPLSSYVEVMDTNVHDYQNYSYYNTFIFSAGTRIGFGMNGVSGSQSGFNSQWGIHLLQ